MSAFYLKYRPQSLDELIGQEGVKKILSAAFLNNKLSHAYLLVGPRGSGKTSTARILAKMVNCEGKNIPCNKCDICISITDGSNMDLIEIDAASNRGIDDIRSLREKVKLSPTSAKKKVYIIDEVHMLTTEAFNALLKTLEEPPAHALFILATTDASKLPQTIMSRVQRLDFKLAHSGDLLEVLKRIIKAEKLDIEEEALKLLVKRGEGSFRDSVKLLDQVASVGEKITLGELEGILKSGQLDDIFVLLENLSKRDSTNSLKTLNKILEGGSDVKIITANLVDILRQVVFIKNGLGQNLVEPLYSPDIYNRLATLERIFTNGDLIKILDLLQNSLEKLKFTSIQSLPLELVVVEICTLPDVIPSEATKQSDKESEISVMLEGAKRPITSMEDSIEPIKSTLQNDEVKIDHPPSNSDSSDIQKLKEKWTYVCETIRPYNFSLEALLRSTRVSECNQTSVVMEVPYSFHQRILEAPKNRDILESILSDILGRSIKVATVLGNRPKREDIANIEVAADDEIIRVAAEIFNSDSVN